MKLLKLSEQSVDSQKDQLKNRIATLQKDLQYTDVGGAAGQIKDEIRDLQSQLSKLASTSEQSQRDKDIEWLNSTVEMFETMWDRYENYKANAKSTDRENRARKYFKTVLSEYIETRVFSVLTFLKGARMTVEEVKPIIQKWRLDKYLDIRKDLPPVVPKEEAGYKAVSTLHEILTTN